MFKPNDYGSKVQLPQSVRNRKQIWLCGILTLVSVVIGAWLFAGVLALCTGANVFFYFRNKKREDEAEQIRGTFEDEDGGFDDDGVELLSKKERKKATSPLPAAQMSRKERKAKYKQFVKEVEDEFDDFDIDEDDGGND